MEVRVKVKKFAFYSMLNAVEFNQSIKPEEIGKRERKKEEIGKERKL